MFYKGVATFQTLLMQVLGQFKRENATTVLSWDDLHWGGCTYFFLNKQPQILLWHVSAG